MSWFETPDRERIHYSAPARQRAAEVRCPLWGSAARFEITRGGDGGRDYSLAPEIDQRMYRESPRRSAEGANFRCRREQVEEAARSRFGRIESEKHGDDGRCLRALNAMQEEGRGELPVGGGMAARLAERERQRHLILSFRLIAQRGLGGLKLHFKGRESANTH